MSTADTQSALESLVRDLDRQMERELTPAQRALVHRRVLAARLLERRAVQNYEDGLPMLLRPQAC